MNRHFKRTHEEEVKRFQCDQCDKSFKHGFTLTNHIRIEHEGIRDAFACDICGKTFARRTTLDAHMKGSGGSIGFRILRVWV